MEIQASDGSDGADAGRRSPDAEPDASDGPNPLENNGADAADASDGASDGSDGASDGSDGADAGRRSPDASDGPNPLENNGADAADATDADFPTHTDGPADDGLDISGFLRRDASPYSAYGSFKIIGPEPDHPCEQCGGSGDDVYLIRDPFRGVASHVLHEGCAAKFYGREKTDDDGADGYSFNRGSEP